jgi:hypothetical protein
MSLLARRNLERDAETRGFADAAAAPAAAAGDVLLNHPEAELNFAEEGSPAGSSSGEPHLGMLFRLFSHTSGDQIPGQLLRALLGTAGSLVQLDSTPDLHGAKVCSAHVELGPHLVTAESLRGICLIF